MKRETRRNWVSSFLAILYYEFLWNLRKKKIVALSIIIFAVVTLQLALPPILSWASGLPLQPDSDFVFRNVANFNGLFIFLLAVATTMNTVSGEFETGSVIPLLTKPVSRTVIFFGKMVAASMTLLAAYAFLGIYMAVAGILIWGPQDNLPLIPLGLVGLTVGTLVWASIVATLGTLSKNSVVAALGSFGFLIGLAIVGLVLTSFGQTAVLLYTPGDGATATTGSCTGVGGFGDPTALSTQTGTNSLGAMLMYWVLTPGLNLSVCGFRFSEGNPEPFVVSSESLSSVAMRSLSVSLGYIAVLLLISWFFFRRSEIME